MTHPRARLLLLPALFALGTAATGCGGSVHAAEASHDVSWRYNVVVPAEGIAILPDSLAAALLAPCARHTPGSITRLRPVGRKEVAQLDEVLTIEIARQRQRFSLGDALPDTALAPQAPIYYAQVVGIERGGRNLLYVNGFSRDEVRSLDDSTAWHYEPMVTCGGGQGFFGTEYDPRTRTLSQFEFNGTPNSRAVASSPAP